MEDLDSAQMDAIAGGFSLIDASISDDAFLLPSSDANIVDSQSDAIQEEAHMGKLSQLLPFQRHKKTGKCNLRKSLAWDSAFFTSDGVLDAEELTSIHEGDHLPSIQEDLSKSTDSISTFQSESLTLESLESDLFSDIRASIQRSSKSSPGRSNSREGESGNGCLMKKVQPSLDSMVESKSSSKKISSADQGRLRFSKPGPVSKMPSVRNRESSSSLLRPQVATGKLSLEGTTLVKRMSVSASRAKSETNISGNMKGTVKGALIQKYPRQVDSRNTLQKTLAPSKLYSASSAVNRSTLRSSQSSCESSCSLPSDNTKPTLPSVRRKIEKNASLPSGSKNTNLSQAPMKSNSRIRESKLSTSVKSVSQLSPNISPASSISDWSSESTSSTATVNLKSSCLKQGHSSLNAVADSNVSQSIPKHSEDGSLEGVDNQVARTLSQSVKQPSTGTATSIVRPGSAKPSALRLPSPKLGFFDGVKAGIKAPSSCARGRFALPSGILAKPAGNCSPSGPSNKVKLSSVAAKVTAPSAIRPGTAKLGSSSACQKTKYAKSSVDLNSIIADSTSEAKDNSICLHNESSEELSSVAAEVMTPAASRPETSAPGPEKINASPKSCAQLQGHSAGLTNIHNSMKDFGLSSGSPTVAIEANSIVAETAAGAKQVTVSSSELQEHSTHLQNDSSATIVDENLGTSSVLPESISLKSAVLGFNKVVQEAGEMVHVGDLGVVTKDLSGVMLQASHVENIGDDPYPASELHKYSSPKCAFSRNSNVPEVADACGKFDFVLIDDSSVSEMEACKEGKQLIADKSSDVADSGPVLTCATACFKSLSSSPASMVRLCCSSGNSVLGDHSSFEDVNDVNNKHAFQGDVVLGAAIDNQDSENASEEAKESVCAEAQEETKDRETVVESKSPSNFQSETALENEINNSENESEEAKENVCAEDQAEELNKHGETRDRETVVQSKSPSNFQSESALEKEINNSENASEEAKENVCAEDQAEELNKDGETRDRETAVKSKSPSNFQSQTALENEINTSAFPSYPDDIQSCIQNGIAQVIPCSLPLPSFNITSEIRTPFAVKNYVSSVADASYNLSVSAVPLEALVKIDSPLSVVKEQK